MTTQPIEGTATEAPDALAEIFPGAVPPPEPDLAPPPEVVAGTMIEPSALPARQTVGSALPDLPVVPLQHEMTAIAQLAVTLAQANACPAAMRGKPNDVFLVLLSARDVGVSLTTAMREFHVIEGKVTLSPKVKLAMVRRSGLGKIWPAADNGPEGATWHAERYDLPGHVISSTFTWADAQLAHLVDSRCTPYEHWRSDRSGGKNSADCLCKNNWKTYPARMVSWRSAGYLLDDVFPEIATGLYSPDEIGAVTDADGEPIAVNAVESLPGMKVGRARGQQQQSAGQDEPQRIDADTAKALRERVDRAKANDDARADLGAWWRERELPAVEGLTTQQVKILEAKLAQIEQRYQLPDAPVAGQQPAQPEPPTEPDPPQPPSEAPAEAPGSAQGPIVADDEPPADPETAQIPPAPGGPPDGNVASWLIAEASAMDAAQVKTAYTVARLEPPKGNVALLRRVWALWQFEQYAVATVRLLSGFSIGDQAIAAAKAEIEAGLAK